MAFSANTTIDNELENEITFQLHYNTDICNTFVHKAVISYVWEVLIMEFSKSLFTLANFQVESERAKLATS